MTTFEFENGTDWSPYDDEVDQLLKRLCRGRHLKVAITLDGVIHEFDFQNLVQTNLRTGTRNKFRPPKGWEFMESQYTWSMAVPPSHAVSSTCPAPPTQAATTEAETATDATTASSSPSSPRLAPAIVGVRRTLSTLSECSTPAETISDVRISPSAKLPDGICQVLQSPRRLEPSGEAEKPDVYFDDVCQFCGRCAIKSR